MNYYLISQTAAQVIPVADFGEFLGFVGMMFLLTFGFTQPLIVKIRIAREEERDAAKKARRRAKREAELLKAVEGS